MHARNYRGRKKGSAITEFGPALFLFVVIIFFPMLDLLGLCAAYCAGWYCNFMVCRELAVRKEKDRTIVFDEVNDNLFSSGIVPFIGVKTKADMAHEATYEQAGSNGMQPMVTCKSTIKATPFITIPWWTGVPGLNEQMVFEITSARPREVTQ